MAEPLLCKKNTPQLCCMIYDIFELMSLIAFEVALTEGYTNWLYNNC